MSVSGSAPKGFDVAYNYVEDIGHTCATLERGSDCVIAVGPTPFGGTMLIVGNNDRIVSVAMSRLETADLIAEVQRCHAGCFDGEWPRPFVPNADALAYSRAMHPASQMTLDPELERLLAEEEEIERHAAEMLRQEDEMQAEAEKNGEITTPKRTHQQTAADVVDWIENHFRPDQLLAITERDGERYRPRRTRAPSRRVDIALRSMCRSARPSPARRPS